MDLIVKSGAFSNSLIGFKENILKTFIVILCILEK